MSNEIYPDPAESVKYSVSDEKRLIKSVLKQYDPGGVKAVRDCYRVHLKDTPDKIEPDEKAAISYNIRMMGLHSVNHVKYNRTKGVVRVFLS